MNRESALTKMPPEAMRRFMRPRSIAVVGAAATPGALGAGVVANLRRFAYAGDIHLINPRRADIDGHACLARVDDLPYGVDCAVLAIPAKAVPDAVEACARRGVGGVVVYASGFAEAGAHGAARQAHIAAVAREAGMVLEGPNCLGYVNNVDGVALTFGPAQPDPMAGRRAMSVVAQSGSMSGVIRAAAGARGLAIAYAVSTGNEAASGIEDYLEFLLDDAHTSVVSLFVEQFRQPARFAAFCRLASRRGVSVVLLHVARSPAGRESARTHTGAMCGDYDVMRAVVEHEGAICVDSLEELLDVSELLVRFPRGLDGDVAIVTESGAFKSIAADYCERLGIALRQPAGGTAESLAALGPELIAPGNPIDLTGLAVSDPQIFGRCMQSFLDDPAYGVVLLNKTGSSTAAMSRSGGAIIDSIRSLAPAKPVIFTTLGDEVPVEPAIVDGFRALNVPFYRSPERALRAVACLRQWRPDARPADGRPAPVDAGRMDLPPGIVPEYRCKQALVALGIPVPAGRLVRDVDAAVSAARELGFPVAMKVQSAQLAHKTEAGGVLLSIGSEQEVASGWATLRAAVDTARPGLAVDGVLVEQMLPRGLEMIVGGRRDPQWGPVVVLGMGGIWTEALGDVVIVPAGAGRPAIRHALEKLKSARLFDGWRGSPPADVDALCEIAERVGLSMLASDDIVEMDLNPVVVYERGAIALDVLFVTAPAVIRST